MPPRGTKLVLAHGDHDQKTHGHGGGSGGFHAKAIPVLRELIKPSSIERSVLLDKDGMPVSDIMDGDASSVDTPKAKAGSVPETLVHTHPLEETLSVTDVTSLDHSALSKVVAITPSLEVHTIEKVPGVPLGDLSRRTNKLFVDLKTKTIDAYIEGKISSKEEYNKLLSEGQSKILRTLDAEGLVKYSVEKLDLPPETTRRHRQLGLALLHGDHDQKTHGHGGGFRKDTDLRNLLGEPLDWQVRASHMPNIGIPDMTKALVKQGHDPANIAEANKLLTAWGGNTSQQQEAREEIAAHIREGSPIGKTLEAHAELETRLYENHKAFAEDRAAKEYKEQISTAERRLAAEPGKTEAEKRAAYEEHYFETFDEAQQRARTDADRSSGADTKLYRKGTMGSDIEAWTTSPEGADISPLSGGRRLAPDHTYTYEQLKAKGYSILGGVGRMMGASGESEITLINLSKIKSTKPETTRRTGTAETFATKKTPPAGPPPQAAIDFLKQKKVRPSFSYKDVWKEEHNIAFAVAKVAETDVLEDVKASLEKSLAEGIPFKQWAKDIKPVLDKSGWSQYAPESQTPHRLKTIYDTNTRTARATGQWQRIERTKKVLPNLKYVLGPSKVHRDQHVEWEGLILPVDDPFWDEHMPPNGFGCRCGVIPMTNFATAKEGGVDETPPDVREEVEDPSTGKMVSVPKGVQVGFNYNPGKVEQRKRAVVGEPVEPEDGA
jgi:SPP1 gp7 family putative phage head morphogenesis protein